MALASHSITSLTIGTLTLLSPVLDSYPPAAIVTDAQFLPQLLELIHEPDKDIQYTIIVVGETNSLESHESSRVRLYKFADLEREGAREAPVSVNVPSMSLEIIISTLS